MKLLSGVGIALAFGLIAGAGVGVASADEGFPSAPVTRSIDTWDRQAVSAAYLGVIAPALEVPAEWTGDADTCRAGSTSTRYTEAALATVNTVRGMLDLPAVEVNAQMSERAQQAALMMTANKALSHYPPSSWLCWSESGSEGAGTSNLALGASGANAVLLYMVDPGANNTRAGHRRWILDTRLTEIGLGDTDRANAMTVIGGQRHYDVSPRWLPWPTEGYFPRQMWPRSRWGGPARLSLGYPGADFSSATVMMSREGVNVPVTVNEVTDGYGENTLVWEADESPRDVGDTTYHVIVQGVRLPSGVVTDHEYDTVVMQPRLDEAVPTTPLFVTASFQASGQFRISWDEPAYSGASPVTDYEVADSSGAVVCQVSVTWCEASSAVERAATFTVRARNASGWSANSTPSLPVDGVSRPGAPAMKPARVKGRTVYLKWSAPADTGGLPIVRYEVRRGSEKWKPVNAMKARVQIPRGQRAVKVSVRAVNERGAGQAAVQRVRLT